MYVPTNRNILSYEYMVSIGYFCTLLGRTPCTLVPGTSIILGMFRFSVTTVRCTPLGSPGKSRKLVEITTAELFGAFDRYSVLCTAHYTPRPCVQRKSTRVCTTKGEKCVTWPVDPRLVSIQGTTVTDHTCAFRCAERRLPLGAVERKVFNVKAAATATAIPTEYPVLGRACLDWILFTNYYWCLAAATTRYDLTSKQKGNTTVLYYLILIIVSNISY